MQCHKEQKGEWWWWGGGGICNGRRHWNLVCVVFTCLSVWRYWPCVWAMDLQIWKYVSPWFESQSLSSWQGRCCICMFFLASSLQHSDWTELLLYIHRNHRLIRDGSPGRPTFTSSDCLRHCSKCKAYYTPAAGPSLDGVCLLCWSHHSHGTRDVQSPHTGRKGELQSAGYDCTDNRENTTPELFAGEEKCIRYTEHLSDSEPGGWGPHGFTSPQIAFGSRLPSNGEIQR